MAFAGNNSVVQNEQATATYLKSIAHDPTRLQQFFYIMPKGGDLHNHIDGAVYAEDLIHFGANEGFCINPKTFAAYKNPSCKSKYQLNQPPKILLHLNH